VPPQRVGRVAASKGLSGLIPAKLTVLHHLRQISVGRCDEAHIHAAGVRASQTLELLFLQHSQELGLQLERNVPDLIQEKRAAVGQLKAPDALRDRSRKGASFVAEQFALQQTRGNSSTIDLDERPFAAMTHNRTEFFTGREAIREFLRRKWAKELDYRLKKELWAFTGHRISVRFEYEWRDESGQWYRTHGNEHWEFDGDGLMRRRDMSANDYPIAESERRIF